MAGFQTFCLRMILSDLASPSEAGFALGVRPLTGPSTGFGGKPVPIPDQAEDKLFGIMRQAR